MVQRWKWLPRAGFVLLLSITLPLFICSYPELPGGWRVRDLLESPAQRSQRGFERRWRARIRGFQRETAPRGKALVFLGSSTLEGFPRHELLQQPEGVIDRAIGGEDLAHLLRRLEGPLPSEVGAWLLYLGAVDHHRDGRDAGAIAADARKVLALLRERSPDAPRFLLGVLPPRGPSAEESERLRVLHEKLRTLCNETSSHYLSPLGTQLVAEGGLKPALCRDRYHLNLSGYRVLLAALRAGPEALASRLR